MATYFARRNPKDGDMMKTALYGLGIGVIAGLVIKHFMKKQQATDNPALLGIGPHMNMPGEFAGPQPGLAASYGMMDSMEFPGKAMATMEFPGKGMANVHDLRPAHNMNHEHGMTGFIGW